MTSNPLFTPARATPGQTTIPMGTHHICPTCGNSLICDQENCKLDLYSPCANHDGPASHSAERLNQIEQDRRRRLAERPTEYQRDLFQREMW